MLDFLDILCLRCRFVPALVHTTIFVPHFFLNYNALYFWFWQMDSKCVKVKWTEYFNPSSDMHSGILLHPETSMHSTKSVSLILVLSTYIYLPFQSALHRNRFLMLFFLNIFLLYNLSNVFGYIFFSE